MLNRVTIAGRMAHDPELHHTNNGTAVVSFTLAVDRDFKDKSTGERATDWIDCVAWKYAAEYISRNGAKGRTLVVSGRLQIRDWTDKDGNKHRTTEVVADSVYFMDGKGGKPHEYPGQEQKFEELGDDSYKLPF